MKKRVFALVGIMLMLACTGITARKEVLLRTMRMTWESSIAESVSLGGGDPSEMTDALRSGDVDRVLKIDWASLRQDAMDGIQQLMSDGQIGFNVMTIMHNELAMFDRAMRALAARAKQIAYRQAHTRVGIPAGDVLTYDHLYPKTRSIYAR